MRCADPSMADNEKNASDDDMGVELFSMWLTLGESSSGTLTTIGCCGVFRDGARLDIGEMATGGESDGPIGLDVCEMGREGEANALGWQAPSPWALWSLTGPPSGTLTAQISAGSSTAQISASPEATRKGVINLKWVHTGF